MLRVFRVCIGLGFSDWGSGLGSLLGGKGMLSYLCDSGLA